MMVAAPESDAYAHMVGQLERLLVSMHGRWVCAPTALHLAAGTPLASHVVCCPTKPDQTPTAWLKHDVFLLDFTPLLNADQTHIDAWRTNKSCLDACNQLLHGTGGYQRPLYESYASSIDRIFSGEPLAPREPLADLLARLALVVGWVPFHGWLRGNDERVLFQSAAQRALRLRNHRRNF